MHCGSSENLTLSVGACDIFESRAVKQRNFGRLQEDKSVKSKIVSVSGI